MQHCRPAISSMSLGRAWNHDMHVKLEYAAQAGFQGVEIFYEDLEYLADSHGTGAGARRTEMEIAAQSVRSLCDTLGLEIFVLQPFSNYDGLKDRAKHAHRLEELDMWMDLADILRIDMIQVPASFLPADEVTDDISVIVSDLQVLADKGAARPRPIKFAYESLCFSTVVDTWEKCWEVIELVDRPNFGACLDTFNIAGRAYADPASPSGLIFDAEKSLARSIGDLIRTVDVRKVFFLQVVDAERLQTPLVQGHEFYVKGHQPRMDWSRNCRLFYGEYQRGGYLPITQITDAIINKLGYQGWVSMEFFNRSMAEKGEHVPREHAARGIESWRTLQRDMVTLTGSMKPHMQPQMAGLVQCTAHTPRRAVTTV